MHRDERLASPAGVGAGLYAQTAAAIAIAT